MNVVDSPHNAIFNAKNDAQGEIKRVLCICSAGLLRSPTAAKILGEAPFNFNTRAAGIIADFALIPVSKALAYWADVFVVMDEDQKEKIEAYALRKPIYVLGIPDNYGYMNETLKSLIYERAIVAFEDYLHELHHLHPKK